MSTAPINPLVGRSGTTGTAAPQGAVGPSGTTPAGQSEAVQPFEQTLGASLQGQSFMNFRPQLADPQTAGLFSDDPSIQALLSNPNVDIETLILAQMTLNNKQLDILNASKVKDVQANQKLNEQNQAERIKQIQATKEKIEAAANKSWWSKLLDVVTNVATFIASAVVLVAAIAAIPATGGASIIPALLAGYMLVQSGAELLNTGWEAATGERLFEAKLSIGALAGYIAGKFGASEETQKWIELGVDLAANLAIMFMVPGAQVKAAGQILKAGATVVAGISQISKGAVDISRAFDVKALADIQAKLDTLQAQIDRLTQNNKQLMEMLKLIQDAKADNDNTVSEVLTAKVETGRRIVMA